MPELLQGVLEYLLGFMDKWTFWIGIVLLIPELLKRLPMAALREKAGNFSHRLFWGLAVFCFFLAGFQAWFEEHKALRAELKKEEPELHAEVIDKITGSIQTQNKSDKSHVLLRIALFNSGAPSVAGGWTLTVNGQSQVKCDRAKIPDPLVLGPQLIFHESQAMYSKVEDIPLQQGARQTGVVWFWCDAPVEVINKNSETLGFQDVNLKRWTAQVKPGPKEETLPYVPGVTP